MKWKSIEQVSGVTIYKKFAMGHWMYMTIGKLFYDLDVARKYAINGDPNDTRRKG